MSHRATTFDLECEAEFRRNADAACRTEIAEVRKLNLDNRDIINQLIAELGYELKYDMHCYPGLGVTYTPSLFKIKKEKK